MGGSSKSTFAAGESTSPTSTTSRDTYMLQNSTIAQTKLKDIEE